MKLKGGGPELREKKFKKFKIKGFESFSLKTFDNTMIMVRRKYDDEIMAGNIFNNLFIGIN